MMMQHAAGKQNSRLKGEWAERHAARLSKHLAVEFTLGPGGFTCEWDPDIPRRPLTNSERRAYRKARDELVARVAQRLGGSVVMLEA